MDERAKKSMEYSWEVGGIHFAKGLLLNLAVDLDGGTLPLLSTISGLSWEMTYELLHQLYYKDRAMVEHNGKFWCIKE